MTRTGNGKVSCGMRSARPSPAKASISSLIVAPMIVSLHWSRTRVRKALATRARWRWCSGGSIPRMVRPMTCPVVIALAAEENRTLSVSTCCASA
jgi:hypothetical protein